jgi:hypothetical protein
VRDVDHVLDRAPDDALGTGVGAAADGHHARQRLAVRGDALLRLFDCRVIDREVLGAVLLGLVGIDLEDFLDQGLGLFTGQFRHPVFSFWGVGAHARTAPAG